jgi:hydrogenase maturation protease
MNQSTEMSNENHKTLVIGIGSEFRSDDAIGIRIARRLNEKIGNKVQVLEHSGDGASLMESWKDASKVILIDAAAFGATPGSIHFVDAIKTKLPKENKHHSSHLFGLSDAIETARVLKKLPPVLHIYGIEGKSFEIGTEISQEVIEAAEEVMKKITSDLRT